MPTPLLTGKERFTGVKSFDMPLGHIHATPPKDAALYTASTSAALTDMGRLVKMDSASANNYTVQPDATLKFPDNAMLTVAQMGAGKTTIVAGAGVTIRSLGGNLVLSGQYGVAGLIKVGPNEWLASGNLAAT